MFASEILSQPESRRVLAVASGGGHWVQLMRLRPAFEHCQVCYIGTHAGYAGEVAPAKFFAVRDANKWNKVGLAVMLMQIAFVVLRVRPHVVVSTGAAPGYFALRLGKFLGCRTLWIDSIANAEELSLSGQLVAKYADERLTQWEHLAQPDGPAYRGSVV